MPAQGAGLHRHFKRLTAFEYEFGTESAHLARYTALAKAPS
jgi:hypothetical protein